MRRTFRTHYDNLKVSQDAPDEVIKAAYRQLALKYHPDKHDNSMQANNRFAIINEAYNILTNPITRKEHDEWIAQKYSEIGEENSNKNSSNRKKTNTESNPESDEFQNSKGQGSQYSTFNKEEKYKKQTSSNINDTYKSSSSIDNNETDSVDNPIINNPHPWRRYFAKAIDIVIYAMVINIVVVFALIFNFDQFVYEKYLTVFDNEIINGALISFYWLVGDIIVLGIFGTSPGRLLYNIRITNRDEQKLSFSETVKRSANVYFYGLGIGFPLFSLICIIMSYSKLTKDGITPWDNDLDLEVSHRKIGFLRYLLIATVFSSFIVLLLLDYL